MEKMTNLPEPADGLRQRVEVARRVDRVPLEHLEIQRRPTADAQLELFPRQQRQRLTSAELLRTAKVQIEQRTSAEMTE